MKRITAFLLLLILFVFPVSVLADVAPPTNPPGSNPQPGSEITQVRMVSENVLIEVSGDTEPKSLGEARVTASFIMRNLGASDESMAARFPISVNDGFFNYPEITDLKIKVNGNQVSYRRANYPDVIYQSEDLPWAEFDVTFPVNQDVTIEVTYTLQGSGYFPYTAFYYTLTTGAGWKDTIGSADVTLRLPYAATPQNVVLNTQIGWAQSTPGGVIQGNEVRWHFENFEPGPYEAVGTMEFPLVAPSAWQAVLTAQKNAEKYPNDGEVWGQLGKTYKEIFLMNKGYRSDAGGEELYRLSVEAYEKCLDLLPNDAQWHAGFAHLLAERAYWDSFMSAPTPEVYRALEEIRVALELAPNDPVVQEVADNIAYMFPDGITKNESGYDFPWLTATPTPLPPTPTIVPVYDPAYFAATYQSELLTLGNGKRAQLTLTLGADYSALLEIKGEDNQTLLYTGTWADLGDGRIQILVRDQDGNEPVLIYKPDEEDNLISDTYASFFGDNGVNMKRIAPAATPEPQATSVSSLPTPTPKPSSSSPMCGSAALAPVLAAAVWFARKRTR